MALRSGFWFKCQFGYLWTKHHWKYVCNLFNLSFLSCKIEVITAPISWCFHKDYLDNLCKAPVQCLTGHMVFNKCQLYFWKPALGIQQARLQAKLCMNHVLLGTLDRKWF